MGSKSSCSCAFAAPAREGKWEVGQDAEKGWEPPSAALQRSSAGARLCGGAGDSWLLTKGCPFRLHWTSASDPLGAGTPPLVLPEPVSIPAKVLQVATGESHALFLAISQGIPRVFSAGSNDFGQLGIGTVSKQRDRNRGVEVRDLSEENSPIGGVSCGGHVSFAVSQRGEIWSWGRNEASGVLGHGISNQRAILAPTSIASLRRKIRAAQVATSGSTTLCISHLGAAFSWGSGICGVHGHGHQLDEVTSKALAGLAGVPIVQVSLGPRHALALGESGEVISWGLMRGTFKAEAEIQLIPKVIDALLDVHVIQVAAGYDHSLALSDQGEVFAWGSCACGALGNLEDHLLQNHALVHKAHLGNVGFVREVACGAYHSLFLSVVKGEAEAKERGPDLWICGMGVSTAEGNPWRADVMDGDGDKPDFLAAPPTGIPLKMKLLNIKRMLAKMS